MIILQPHPQWNVSVYCYFNLRLHGRSSWGLNYSPNKIKFHTSTRFYIFGGVNMWYYNKIFLDEQLNSHTPQYAEIDTHETRK